MATDSREDSQGEADAWIRLACSGDEHAMERVIERLEQRLTPFVEKALNGTPQRCAQKQDVLQHTLFDMSERLTRMPFVPTEGQLVSFAKRAVQFRILDLRREVERLRGQSVIDTWSELGGESGTGAVTRADESEHLRELVARLPERYREVVRSCALEGKSFVEIAARSGLQRDTVRKRYTKALELLRQVLERGKGD